MPEPSSLHPGLDHDLIARINQHYIHEGPLYGSLPQSEVNADERRELIRVGWIAQNYIDQPVMEPPQHIFDWAAGRITFRDNILHLVAHRFPNAPLLGTQQAILEELIDSAWEQQVDDLRVVLHSWAFASAWAKSSDEEVDLQGRQSFSFYTDQMQKTAQAAFRATVAAPAPDHEFWELVKALEQPTDNKP